MIDRILRAIFVRRDPKGKSRSEEALLNYSLELAQEWGKQWLKPIQGRLHGAYPELSETECSRLNSIAQAAMKCGHDLVYSMAQSQGKDNINEAAWRQSFKQLYPWVDERNLRHLFSTGMYYAWKDGVD
jgi:hypothetical protein